MKKNPITLIAAMGLDRTIGLNNAMPWHLPEDLRHFKARTLGKVMIMGRHTFESIGKPLPDRTTLVVSRSLAPDALSGCTVLSSFDQALHTAKELSAENQEIIVAGGGQIYTLAMNAADRMALTLIQAQFQGDTFFPEWAEHEWELQEETSHQQTDGRQLRYSFLEYRRRT